MKSSKPEEQKPELTEEEIAAINVQTKQVKRTLKACSKNQLIKIVLGQIDYNFQMQAANQYLLEQLKKYESEEIKNDSEEIENENEGEENDKTHSGDNIPHNSNVSSSESRSNDNKSAE